MDDRLTSSCIVCQIWDFITANGVDPVTVFMGVPTMYVKLIAYYEQSLEGKVDPKQFQDAIRKHIRSTDFIFYSY